MLRGSITVARVRGIPIRIHFTFLIVLPYLALVIAANIPVLAPMAGVSPASLALAPWVWGLLLALALGVCILLHELSHAVVGQRGGGQVRSITLLIIGGVSELTEFPKKPGGEALMALAGPLMSLFLGGSSAMGFALASGPNARFAFYYLAQMNILLGLFNLLPAFPMDGGRILRAALSHSFGRVRATRIAAGIGKALALLFGLVGLLGLNPLLLLIGFFVYLGAQAEARSVIVGEALAGLRVRHLMGEGPPSVRAEATVAEVIAQMQREMRTAFLVAWDSISLGLVTARMLRQVPPALREATPVSKVMITELPVLHPDDDLQKVVGLLARFELLPVVEGGRLVGGLSREAIAGAIEVGDLGRRLHPPSGQGGEARP